MKKLSRQNQKLIYWLIDCYSYYLANIEINNISTNKKPKISEFYKYKAKEELKKIYLKATGQNLKSYHPFNKLSEKIAEDVGNILKKNITDSNKIKLISDKLEDFAILELQKFLISIDGTFSLSMQLMSNDQAVEFTRFLFDYFLEHDVAVWEEIRQLINEQDGRAYVYTMLKNRRCAVCNAKHDEYNSVDLDHFKTVASIGGYKHDRGQGVYISLCRKHHQEKHTIGVKSFSEKYYLQGITLTTEEVEELKKIYKNHFKGVKDGEDKAKN